MEFIFILYLTLWQSRHTCLFLSASFFTPTLGNKLCLLTNNKATSSVPLAHKNVPNSFFGHQLVTSHQGVNIASTPHQGTSPHLANAAHNEITGQHLVFNWSAHYSSSLSLHHCQCVGPQCSDGLTPPSRSTSPQHLSRANASLTQPVHSSAIPTHSGELVLRPQQPVLQPGIHCALQHLLILSLPHPATRVPQVSPNNFSSTQYLYGPFQGPTYYQRGYHNMAYFLALT